MSVAFERITKKEIGNRFLTGVIAGQNFSRVFYEEVSFLKRHFKQCTWLDCRFKRTSFRAGTRFENCRFENCRFELQHTYFGGPSYFRDCEFQNCRFDSVQFWASSFERCSFASEFANVVFYGPEAAKGWQTKLIEVDFSQSKFEDVDFRGGIDLTSTKLPNGYVSENVPYGSDAPKAGSKPSKR